MRDLSGLRVTHLDGTTETVDCTSYMVLDGLLVTETRHAGIGFSNYTQGPRFPLVSIRKFEEIR